MNGNISLKTGRSSSRRREEKKIVIPSLSSGLSSADVEKSRKAYGQNTFSAKKPAGFMKQFFKNLNDPIIKILIAALIVNLIFSFSGSNPAESIGIAVTVLISALVTTISEHSSGAAFEKLYSTLGDTNCRVIRNGEECDCPVSAVVRYDLVCLFPGDTVPADGIMMRGEVSCDESSLTGESRAVKKSFDQSALNSVRSGEDTELKASQASLYRGSHIISGSGVMLVTAVGDKTVYGAIAGELALEDTVSPLKKRLSELAKTISKIGYVSAAVVAAVHLADAFWFDVGQNPALALARLSDVKTVVSELIKALTLAISVIVVAVPEGLPMMITVVLSSNMKRMLRSGVLVRRLVGIETSGAVDMLFTDKTGTLTTGKLSVSSFLTAEGEYGSARSCPQAVADVLKKSCYACSSVFNQTECAVNLFSGIKSRTAVNDPEKTVPFDSSRKYAAGLGENKTYIRGAAEYLLPSCLYYLSSDGTVRPMSDEMKQRLDRVITDCSSRSCRLLLLGVSTADSFAVLRSGGTADGIPITFVGFYVIRDEVRRGVKNAVRECQDAGISVVMLTGDNSGTAAGIAVECGILPEKYHTVRDKNDLAANTALVIDGGVLRTLSDDEVTAVLGNIKVISRVNPTDKSRLVRLAQKSGHIAGMTGDGVNDAPALKAADVGFAMGSGTDVAREAGDIVITDDNFVSITQAVLYGRTIFSSIRKFITFQLTMNMAAVGVSVLGTMFGIESPVTVIQMLWVNIIMDTLGSLAFAGEPSLPEYMKMPPISRGEPILTRSMIRQMLLSGGYAIVMSMFFLFSPDVRHAFGGGEVEHLTRFFALFIFMGIFIAMCTRTPRVNLLSSISKNRAFMIIMPAVAVIQLLIIYFGGEVFRCVPLSAREIGMCALFAFTVIPADCIRKAVTGIVCGKREN